MASIQNTVTENPRLQAEQCTYPFNFPLLLPSNGNNKLFSLSLPVDGSHGPCDTNAQEDIDSVRASNISNGVICSVVLNSGGLGGESV